MYLGFAFQGGEFQILQSIDWRNIVFDVLCIETEPSNRPPGYDVEVTQYLEERGYRNVTGQIGRNICKYSFFTNIII